MIIQLMNSREPGATPEDLIIDVIEFGKRRLAAVGKSRFYKDRRMLSAIADIMRDCNRVLGAAGNFKNGCIYREAGIAEKWQCAVESLKRQSSTQIKALSTAAVIGAGSVAQTI